MAKGLHFWLLGTLVAQFAFTTCSAEDSVPRSYIIQFNSDNGGDSSGSSQLDQFAKQMQSQSIPFTFVRNYTTLSQGTEIRLDDSYSTITHNLPSVLTLASNKLMAQSTNVQTSATVGKKVAARENVYLIRNSIAQKRDQKNIYGRGVKIGFVDSGLDYRHPAFGGCFKTCKSARVIAGYDFVGDAYTGANDPLPDSDPLDTCNGHGTHVTGIAAGNDGDFQGVAPKAQIGAYRVLGCTGTTQTGIVISALLAAYNDGMNIINVSVGSPSGFPGALLSDLATQMTRRGVMVVSAVGNDGANSLFLTNAPAVGFDVIAVGSMDQDQFYSKAIKINSMNDRLIPRSYSQFPDVSFKFSKKTLALATDAQGSLLACNPITANLMDKVAFVQRGGCYLENKAINAKAAGAIAMVIYDTVQQAVSAPAFQNQGCIPSVMIELRDGLLLESTLRSKKIVKITSDEEFYSQTSSVGDSVSPFSSWGPGADLSLKPDLVAPGRYIMSTLPIGMGSYGVASGTSMASPFVAGVFALLREYYPGLTNQQYRMRLLSRMYLLDSWDTDSRCSPAQQGYGALDMTHVFNAPDVDVAYNPALLDIQSATNGAGFNFEIQFTVSSDNTYTTEWGWLPNEQITMFNPDGSIASVPLKSDLAFDIDNIEAVPDKLRPHSTNTMRMTITSNGLNTGYWLFGGFILFTLKSKKESVDLQVPFLAMNDNYSNMPLLPPPNTPTYPHLVDLTTNQPLLPGYLSYYRLSEKNYPAFQFSLQFNVDLILVYAVDLGKSDQSRYQLTKGEESYFVRNYTPEMPPYYFSWSGSVLQRLTNGTDVATQAPTGTYRFQAYFLKPLKDKTSRNDDDFIIWTSQPFIMMNV
ncbi:hypothetical protein H4R33_003549 [Dimargaris cristalligena]|nr:hypothetical protein H4R33_003549 [Dimargaris cristalligena]